MQDFSRTKIIASFFLSALAVCCAGGIFVFVAVHIYDRGASRKDLAVRISAFARDRDTVHAAASLLAGRATDLVRIKRFFINRREPVAFVEDLELIAARTGNTMDLRVDEAPGTAEDIVLHLTVEGSRPGLMRYLRALESMPYGIHIEDLRFEAVGRERYRARSPAPGGPIPDARLILAVRAAAS